MKKTFLNIMIVGVMLSAASCKKNAEPVSNGTFAGGQVYVTMTADNGDKTAIADGGTVTWSEDDRLLVVSPQQGVLGTLNILEGSGQQKGTFGGYLPTWSKAERLNIFYLGSEAEYPTQGETSYKLDITNQPEGTLDSIAHHLQVMMGTTRELTPGTDKFGPVSFKSLVSIAKFKTNGTTASFTGTVYCRNAWSTASLSLIDGEFSSPTTDEINLGTPKDVHYMALIPGTTRLTFTDGDTSFDMNKTIEAGKFYTYYGNAIEIGTVPTVDYVDFNDSDMSVTGLPLWAKYNVGVVPQIALSPSAQPSDWYGEYYAWAGTTDVSNTIINVSWENCPYTNGTYSEDTGEQEDTTEDQSLWNTNSNVFTKYVPSDKTAFWGLTGDPDNKRVLDPTDDIANVKLHGTWRMPSGGELGEWKELKENTYFMWKETYNGITNLNGWVVFKVKDAADKGKSTNKSGVHTPSAPVASYDVNSDTHIFIPASGHRGDNTLYNSKTHGYYWSSDLNPDNPSQAYRITFDSNDFYSVRTRGRYSGHPVRAVSSGTKNPGAGVVGNFGDSTW